MPSETGNLVLGGICFILIQHMFNRFDLHKVSSWSLPEYKVRHVKTAWTGRLRLAFHCCLEGGRNIKISHIVNNFKFLYI
ncbi:hypothetical protein [Neisseria cinerea]|uniref:hypothetical protein n=1 Tax=Neisseria cinerea TaxID=483 RepID=UPI0027DF38B0|nr:hypothetical protein [Neisseria cinerea]